MFIFQDGNNKMPAGLRGYKSAPRNVYIMLNKMYIDELKSLKNKYMYFDEMKNIDIVKALKTSKTVPSGDTQPVPRTGELTDAQMEMLSYGYRSVEEMQDVATTEYAIGFRIYGEIYESDETTKTETQFNPLQANLRDTMKHETFDKYIYTELNNINTTPLSELIVKHKYIEDECWLNVLYEIYGEDVLREKRQNNITREMLLETIGKTEETIKYGVSIDQISLFFTKYNLRLRVIDQFHNCIYTHTPEKFNNNYKTCYVLVKDNHVYRIRDTNEIEQKISEEKEIKIEVSDNFRCESKAPITHYMINTVEELPTLAFQEITRLVERKDMTRNNKMYIIVKGDELEKAFYDLRSMGYIPGISDRCGRIDKLYLNFRNDKKSITCIIKSQQLAPTDKGSADVNISCINSYNRMNSIMTNFTNKLFNNLHKSFYNMEDIILLRDCKSIAPVGRLNNNVKNGIEIDVRKAYTAAFCKIDRIPIFNEFDNFTHYDNSDIQDYNLYLVKSKKYSIFLNRVYNLVYGKYLKQLNLRNVEIIYYKSPSIIQEVNYKQLIDEVYDSFISDDKDEDIYYKKLICNVSFGLLEKGVNKRCQSHIFESLDEAIYYKGKYGGYINILDAYNENNETRGQKFYVLNINKDKK
jgi:hypothetical protein